jgi:hypothetical protein
MMRVFEKIDKVLVRFQVLMVTNVKMAVFWDVSPCSLVDIDCHFRGAYCLYHQRDEYVICVKVGLDIGAGQTNPVYIISPLIVTCLLFYRKLYLYFL